MVNVGESSLAPWRSAPPRSVLSSGGVAAATAATDSPSGTAVVECSSGIVTQGDVQTSSRFVAKVPAGEQPDIPGGCTVQTG